MEHGYIKQIFERTNVQQIRELLVCGIELGELPDKKPYGERLEDGSLHIVKRLKKFSQDEEEFAAMYDEFSEAAVAYTNVFLEIGMKAGARLLFQLLYENE